MKNVALGFAVAFVLALELVAWLIFLVARSPNASENVREATKLVAGFGFDAAAFMLLAAIVTLLYGVMRRLYRWAVKDLGVVLLLTATSINASFGW